MTTFCRRNIFLSGKLLSSRSSRDIARNSSSYHIACYRPGKIRFDSLTTRNIRTSSIVFQSYVRFRQPDGSRSQINAAQKFSSLAGNNPMFPQPDLNKIDVESPSKDKKDDDDSFLSKHGGKMALVSLVVTTWLITTYFLGNPSIRAIKCFSNDFIQCVIEWLLHKHNWIDL